MNSGELKIIVEQEIKGLSSQFETDDYTNAVNQAIRDTGWTFPITTDFRITWMNRRTKRNLFFMLWTGSASKFKIDQINLQQKFDHYGKLVKLEDEAFEAIQESELSEFANVSAVQMFGHKIDAGFASDAAGQDTTYDDDNVVIISPSSLDD